MKTLIALSIAVFPIAAHAQWSMPACSAERMYFEYQVQRRARWVADTSLAVQPLSGVRDPAALVQFVVDTTGVPVLRTFEVLVNDSALVGEVRRSLSRWRYVPAKVGDCLVSQLVQTAIGRKGAAGSRSR